MCKLQPIVAISLFDRFLQKSFQILMLKILTFCYPGLNKVTLVNQLSINCHLNAASNTTWLCPHHRDTTWLCLHHKDTSWLCLRHRDTTWLRLRHSETTRLCPRHRDTTWLRLRHSETTRLCPHHTDNAWSCFFFSEILFYYFCIKH